MRINFFIANRGRFGVFWCGEALFLVILALTISLSSTFAEDASIPIAGRKTNDVMSNSDAYPAKTEIIRKTGTLQMPFIANNGQINEGVCFYAKTFGCTVFVTKEGEIVYSLPNNKIQGNGESHITKRTLAAPQLGLHELNRLNGFNRFSLFHAFYSYLNTQHISHRQNTILRSLALKEILVDARITGIIGEQPAVTKVNYFIGRDKTRWNTNVPTYNQVNMGEVYKGVELRLKAYGDNVEKLFCVKPGGSPDSIKVQLEGSKFLRVNRNGQLEADTELGLVKFTRPIAYQEIEGKRVEVAVEYNIHSPVTGLLVGKEAIEPGCKGKSNAKKSLTDMEREYEKSYPATDTANGYDSRHVYGFTVASYDKTHDLIIDPLLASTYLGGSRSDNGNSIALDINGNVFVTGNTQSRDFPTTIGAYETTLHSDDNDIFISKLDSGLTSLLASTFLGGAMGGEKSYSLILDPNGNVYVTGITLASDFPTTNGAYDTTYDDNKNNTLSTDIFYLKGKGSHGDVFISKLDGALTNLLASTYLGGTGLEYGKSLVLDASGNVYLTGGTQSTDFPTTKGAYDSSSHSNTDINAFISVLDEGLTNLLASTYLGGFNSDEGNDLTLDSNGNVYVTGNTLSKNFPTTFDAYNSNNRGFYDAFVAKLNSGLTNLLASTYLGGTDYDYSSSIVLDADENVYVAGWTLSSDFPTTSGAYDISYNNNSDVFVSELNNGLTSLPASTYLGDSGHEKNLFMTLDAHGNVFVTGNTNSSKFPITDGAYDTNFNGGNYDIFVSKLNSGLTDILASTFLGGSGSDWGQSITIDSSGNVYVVGSTYSINFPITNGAYDTSIDDYDVFISKLDGNLSVNDGCVAESITVDTKKLTISKEGNSTVTITVEGANDCQLEEVAVMAIANENSQRLMTISPGSQDIDANGQAVFSITAKDKRGNAVVKFKASGLTKLATVRVEVR